MSSLLETFMAGQVAGSIDKNGKCSHACYSDKPFFLCEVEASDLKRFDPEGYQMLKNVGVTIEEVTLDDIEEVGRKYSRLKSILEKHGDTENKFLYKYAISYRTRYSLAVSKSDPYHNIHVECTKKFKNPMKEYP